MALYEYSYLPAVFHFKVTIAGFSEECNFQEASGLTVDMETEDVKEGGENRFTHKLPVRSKYTQLTLKRGIIKKNSPLISWVKKAMDEFDFTPKNITIELLNEKHSPVLSWALVNAYPVKWSMANLDANKNEFLIETLVLNYNHFTFNYV